MTIVFTIIAAVIIFALLVFVHELGHFLVAKATGVKVIEFAIGMGPKLFGFKRGETLYSIRIVPMGGFCAMEGEDEATSDERAFSNKPAWARLSVLAAGAFMNILLGFILICIITAPLTTIVTNTVAKVDEGSAAMESGLMAGDKILKVDGKRTPIAFAVNYHAVGNVGRPTDFLVKRNGEMIRLTINAEEKYGFALSREKNSVLMTASQAWHETGFFSKIILSTLGDLIQGKVAVTQMSGPIGIVSEISSAVTDTVENGRQGFERLMTLAILLTINLGIFNLLPLPALDGGRIFFVLIELVRRKKIPPEKEGMVHFVGFVILILFSIFIAGIDITRLGGR